MKISTVMHPLPHTVGVDQTLLVALDMLREHGIRHLPVCQGGRLCGILSERDIEFALRVEKVPSGELLVEECYTTDPYTVGPDTPVADVARRMAHEHIGCAVVVEKDKAVGIFTTVDACRVLAEQLSGKADQ